MKEVTYYKSEGDSVQVFNLAEHDAKIRKQTLEEHKAMCDSCIYKVSKEDIDAIKADAIEEFANLLKEKVDEDTERFNTYTFTCIDEVAEKLKENNNE